VGGFAVVDVVVVVMGGLVVVAVVGVETGVVDEGFNGASVG